MSAPRSRPVSASDCIADQLVGGMLQTGLEQYGHPIDMDFRHYHSNLRPKTRYLSRSVDCLTEGALMCAIVKIVSVLSCGVLLCLGLSQTAHAGLSDEAGANRLTQAKVIKGDLVRVDYGDYFVKEKDRPGSPCAYD